VFTLNSRICLSFPTHDLMKKKFFILVISLLSLESAVLTSLADTVTNSTNVNTGIKPPAAAQRPKIYDENADGSEQITEALAVAKKEGKHVLLQFGVHLVSSTSST
jgi:hypothetical protein